MYRCPKYIVDGLKLPRWRLQGSNLPPVNTFLLSLETQESGFRIITL